MICIPSFLRTNPKYLFIKTKKREKIFLSCLIFCFPLCLSILFLYMLNNYIKLKKINKNNVLKQSTPNRQLLVTQLYIHYVGIMLNGCRIRFTTQSLSKKIYKCTLYFFLVFLK